MINTTLQEIFDKALAGTAGPEEISYLIKQLNSFTQKLNQITNQ